LELGLDLWVTLHPPYYPVQGDKVSKKIKKFRELKPNVATFEFWGGKEIKGAGGRV
jgi:hypothetical protein